MNRYDTSRVGFLCCLSLVLLWAACAPALAQTPHEALVQAIEERARQDVALDRPQASASDLHLLFGERAAAVGLSLLEVQQVYDQAYAAATPAEPWWEPLRPNATWISGVILFVLGLLAASLKKELERFVEWLKEQAYKRLARYRIFWGVALRRYRLALVANYQELKIPFRAGRPLDMSGIYVPLKVLADRTGQTADAYQAIAQHQRLMVVGVPGAGKTMLLKHMLLKYAQAGLEDLPRQPIPILIELHRLDANAEIEEHLVQALELNSFPNPQSFVNAHLERNDLLLLFDGLDEVSSEARAAVAQNIKDLQTRYPCQAIVTCRTAVYRDEFADWADATLKVADFGDQQIQRFLHAWPDMPPDKSAEHLLRQFSERPQLVKLASNPLLLTIIAFLYTDTPTFVLPNSRAEFYRLASSILLDQWKETQNQYKAAHKRLVLQHLALFNQDRATVSGQDRRTLDLPTILIEIKRVLPDLNLEDQAAQPLLDEIVERSGLLLALDGGTRYQFTHLTLQEFFAAQKLESHGDGLLARFQADPDAWRETVKLWCGLEHDSTMLVRKLDALDPILAFECLADARQVDAALAEEISDRFKACLGEDGPSGEAIVRAFAAVATGRGPRGQAIFAWLSTMAADAGSPKRSLAAASALAQTNLLEAAETLANLAPERVELRPLLTEMGDLATPHLEKWIDPSAEWTLDSLQTIGTPQAARALVPLLWAADEALSHAAAWRLAALLPNSRIEATLRQYPLTQEQRAAPYLDCVWEPFEPEVNSALRLITGRVAHLLDIMPSEALAVAHDSLDSRLLLPICTVAGVQARELGAVRKLLVAEHRESLEERLKRLLEPANAILPDSEDERRAFVCEALDKASADPPWRALFDRLPEFTKFELLRRLVQGTRLPDVKDWHNFRRPSEYQFASSWQVRGLKVLVALVLILALLYLGDTILHTSSRPDWETGFYIVCSLVLLVALWWQARTRWDLQSSGAILLLCGLAMAMTLLSIAKSGVGGWLPGALSGAVVGILLGILIGALDRPVGAAVVGAMLGAVIGAIVGAVPGAIVGAVFSWASLFVTNLVGPAGLAGFWGAWALVCVVLYCQAQRRKRAAENPLHGLLPGVGPASAIPRRQGPLRFFFRR